MKTVWKDNLLMEPLSVRQATRTGTAVCLPGGVVDVSYPKSTTRRGRCQEGGMICPTLTRNAEGSILKYDGIMEMNDEKQKRRVYRIRKLTPRECFRLMGVNDEDIDKIQASGVSKSQQYKMAGNSIVVDCLYYIFRSLFTEQEKTTLF